MLTAHRFLFAAAAISLLLATVLGAFGTHALQGSLSAGAWSAYETAVQYQFYHGLGLICTTLLAERYPGSRALALSGWLLLAGIILFCGSLYLLAFGAPTALGMITPLGGTAFMAGWLALGIGVLRARS